MLTINAFHRVTEDCYGRCAMEVDLSDNCRLVCRVWRSVIIGLSQSAPLTQPMQISQKLDRATSWGPHKPHISLHWWTNLTDLFVLSDCGAEDSIPNPRAAERHLVQRDGLFSARSFWTHVSLKRRMLVAQLGL